MATELDPKISPKFKAAARLVYIAGKASNGHKRIHEAARKALFKELEKAGIAQFSFETSDGAGKKVRLDVLVETPEREFIDVALLRGLVDDATFMKLVSATKKIVEDHDKGIAVKVAKTGPGTRNVFVAVAE